MEQKSKSKVEKEVLGPEDFLHEKGKLSAEKWEDCGIEHNLDESEESVSKSKKEVLGPEDFLKTKGRNSVEEWGCCGEEYVPAEKKNSRKKPDKLLVAIALTIVALLVMATAAIVIFSKRKSESGSQASGQTTDTITIQVNGKAEEIGYAKVPTCIGLKVEEAESLLGERFNEKPIIVYEESEKPEGTVILQSIESGKNVPNISVLTLFVSKGKSKAQSNSDGTVDRAIPLKKVNMSPNKVTLEPGEIRYITTTIEPANATNANFFLSSSDESIVVISGTNVITSISAGKAKIFAVNSSGEKIGHMDVNVVVPITEKKTEQRQPDTDSIYYPNDEIVKTEYVFSSTENRRPAASETTRHYATVYVVSFDANGGSVQTRVIRAESGETVSMPLPERDYYQFDGWYTSENGGAHYTSSTPITSDVVLYAHWRENPVSGWVSASDVPSAAQVVNTKYSYQHRYYETSSNSAMNGWTKYKTERTGWGSTQGPVSSDPSNGARNVWSEKYVSSSTKHYKYYHRTNGKIWGSDSSAPGWARHSIDLKYQLTYKHTGTNSGYKYYGDYTCPKCGTKAMWLPDGTYNEDHYSTRWYYQEPVYTYYYYKDVSEESSVKPSGSEYSDIQTLVQYRSK